MVRLVLRAFLLVFALFSSKIGFSQSPFGASLLVGAIASQIDGDASAGYNKPGLQAGVQADVRLGSKKEWSLGIRFSQRGSQTEIVQGAANPFAFSCRTNYVDVPVQFHLLDWAAKDDDGEFFKIRASAGLSYGRLIYSKTDENSLFERLKLAQKNDIGLLLGASFFASRHLGFRLGWQRSLNYLFNPEKHLNASGQPVLNAKPLLGKHLDLQVIYRL